MTDTNDPKKALSGLIGRLGIEMAAKFIETGMGLHDGYKFINHKHHFVPADPLYDRQLTRSQWIDMDTTWYKLPVKRCFYYREGDKTDCGCLVYTIQHGVFHMYEVKSWIAENLYGNWCLIGDVFHFEKSEDMVAARFFLS